MFTIAAPAVGGRVCAGEPLVTTAQIQSAPEEQRTRILGCVTATLADDARLASRVKRSENGWGEPDRAAFQTSLNALDERAKCLRRALKAAERAPDEAWAETRTKLADTFAAYTAAADRLHFIAKHPHNTQVAQTSQARP